MKTTNESVWMRKVFTPRWIALAVLAGFLVVLALSGCQSTAKGQVDAVGYNYIGAWSGDCTVLN